MNKKYPFPGKEGASRPYMFYPDDKPEKQPKWFSDHKKYFQEHCQLAYFSAMEAYVAGMPSAFLKKELAEASSDPGNIDYKIIVDLDVETYAYVGMMEAEVAYRKKVDAERLKKRQKTARSVA